MGKARYPLGSYLSATFTGTYQIRLPLLPVR
jgi:hypothetical protein